MFCIRILDIQSASFSFSERGDYVALRRAKTHKAEGRSPEAMLPSGSKNLQNSCWWDILNLARTHFEQSFRISHQQEFCKFFEPDGSIASGFRPSAFWLWALRQGITTHRPGKRKRTGVG